MYRLSRFLSCSPVLHLQLETQVTRKVEDAVASVSGVKHINSTVNDGQSTTVVEFNMDVPTQTALNDTKDAVDRVRGNLPSEIEAPIVSKIDVEGQAILRGRRRRRG